MDLIFIFFYRSRGVAIATNFGAKLTTPLLVGTVASWKGLEDRNDCWRHLLGSNTAMPGGLHARLCHAFLVLCRFSEILTIYTVPPWFSLIGVHIILDCCLHWIFMFHVIVWLLLHFFAALLCFWFPLIFRTCIHIFCVALYIETFCMKLSEIMIC